MTAGGTHAGGTHAAGTHTGGTHAAGTHPGGTHAAGTHRWLEGPWLAVTVAALAHISLFPGVADLDSFYHAGHAAAYLEGSVFDTSLPWATRSIIGDIGGDLWWGFHVLLIPFVALLDVSAAIRLAAWLVTTGLALTVWWVLRRHAVAWAGLWAASFLVLSPNLLFRELMLRPHVISLAAGLALLSCLVRGRWWHVLLLSTLVSWVHLSLFWFPPVVALAYAVARIPVTVLSGRERPDTGVGIRAGVPMAIVGVLLGWLLRPDALATATLLNAQLIQLFAQKAAGLPLTFAAELSPLGPLELVRTTWLFTGAWLIACLLFLRDVVSTRLRSYGQARATLLVAACLISVAFGLLALISARRAMEQWAAFGFLMLPLLGSATTTSLRADAPARRRWVAGAAAMVVVAHLGWSAWRHQLNVDLVAFPGDSLREAATFMEAQSSPGEVVFHARWDNFGPLLAFNRTNRYLGGMDPIFQFAHDPQAFWEFFYLSTDATNEWTCDAYPCIEGVATDTYVALDEHFEARWVLVEPRRNPRLTLFLLNDDRFRLALETRREAVFELIDPLR